MRKLLILVVTALAAGGDTPSQRDDSAPDGNNAARATTKPSGPRSDDARYVLGPDDQLNIWGLDIEEISGRPVHLDASGELKVPLIGRIRAAGMTISELEEVLTKRLSVYVQEPQIVVTLAEYRSQPVSVLGAVNNPGSHQLRGRKTVAEVLALAGGVKSDAGSWVKLTRRGDQGDIPHARAAKDTDGRFTYATLNMSSITDAKDQADNIIVRPHDILTVPRAELVYVIGEVQKAGGFVLNERESMSVLQALAMAGGLNQTASAAHAKILRTDISGSSRKELPVDIGRMMAGKTPDVPLMSEDILIIPGSKMKKVATRTVEAAIQAVTGLVIWGR
jgi:polysaccharide export outer membrane protein